jgi:glycosyltransferase involved in cell wall biosynthesis
MHFLGDRADVPRLLAGLDIFVWLAHGEEMPHVIAEAGAAGLPVIATSDHGATEQITHGETALFVPPQAPGVVAAAIVQLLGDRALRRKLGQNLHATVERDYSTEILIPRWQALFEEFAAKEVMLRGVFAY